MPRSALLNSGLPIDDQVAQSIDAQLDPEGSGVPTIAGYAGQRYWRIDAPATAGSRLYICTVAGAAGAATWVATAV